VKSTVDNELAPAAQLELLEYIFREVFYFFLSLSRVAAAASVSCSDHYVSAKISLYVPHVLRVVCLKRKTCAINILKCEDKRKRGI